MRNEEVRKAVFESRLKYWQVAEYLGVNAATLSRWLRAELPQEKKEQILQIIADHRKQVN